MDCFTLLNFFYEKQRKVSDRNRKIIKLSVSTLFLCQQEEDGWREERWDGSTTVYVYVLWVY